MEKDSLVKCYESYKSFVFPTNNRIKPDNKLKKDVSIFLEYYEDLLFYYFVFSFFVCKNYSNNLDSSILNFYLERSSGIFFDASHDLLKMLRVHAIDEATGKYVSNITAKTQRIQRLKENWYSYFENWAKRIKNDDVFFDIFCNNDCIDLPLSDIVSEFSNRGDIVSSEYSLLLSSFTYSYREEQDVDFLNSLLFLKNTIYRKDVYRILSEIVFNKFGGDGFYTKEIFYHRYYDDFIKNHDIFWGWPKNINKSSYLDFDLIVSLHNFNESLELEANHESSLKLFFYSRKGKRVYKKCFCYNCNVPVSEPWVYKYTNKGEVDLCVRCKQEIYERSFSAVDALNKALPGSFGNKK